MIVKMADVFNNKLIRIVWLKGPHKGKFDFMKMKNIKEWLQRDRDALVLANKKE